MRPEHPLTPEHDYDMYWRTPLQGGPCPICGDTTMSRQYGAFNPDPRRYVTHASGRVCQFPPGWMYTPPDGTWHWRGGETNPLAPRRLNELAAEIHNISKAKGFWPDDAPRNPAEVLMLIVTEVAEAMEAIRDGMPLNEARTGWISGPNMVSHSLEQVTLSNTGWRRLDGVPVEMIPDVWRSLGYIGKPEGVPSEMADIIIRVLDACAAWGIDIDTAIREKIEYNAIRDHLHGRAR